MEIVRRKVSGAVAWTKSLEVKELTLTGGLTTGVLNASAALTLGPNERADLKVVCRTGSSVLNLQEAIEALFDVTGDVISRMDSEVRSRIARSVDRVVLATAMIRAASVEVVLFGVQDLSGREKVLVSLAWVLSELLGVQNAAECLTSIMVWLENFSQAGTPRVMDRERIRSAADDVLKSLRMGGNVEAIQLGSVEYNSLLGLEQFWTDMTRFADTTVQEVAAAVVWVTGLAKHVQGGEASRKCTRSVLVHKMSYLLEKMGWDVVSIFGDGNSPTPRQLLYQIDPVLPEIPTLLDQQQPNPRVVAGGIGVDATLHHLRHMVCSKYGENSGKLAVYLDAWGVGEAACDGTSFEPSVTGDVCSTRVVVPVENKSRASTPSNASGLRALIGSTPRLEQIIDKLCDLDATKLKDFREENPFMLANWTGHTHVQKMVLSAIFGYMYKWVTCLHTSTVASVKVDTYRVNWLNDPEGFAKRAMKLISHAEKTEELTLTTHLRLLGVFIYGCDPAELEEEKNEGCVGLWTGSRLLHLRGVTDPISNFAENCAIVVFPCWYLNFACVSGKYIISSPSDTGLLDTSRHHVSKAQTGKVSAAPPSTSMSIGVGPDLIRKDGSMQHQMYAQGIMVHKASIMAGIARLQGKTAICTCAKQGTVWKECEGGFKFPITDRELMQGLVLSETLQNGTVSETNTEWAYKGVVLVDGDEKWIYAAACMYGKFSFNLAGTCLECAAGEDGVVVTIGLQPCK